MRGGFRNLGAQGIVSAPGQLAAAVGEYGGFVDEERSSGADHRTVDVPCFLTVDRCDVADSAESGDRSVRGVVEFYRAEWRNDEPHDEWRAGAPAVDAFDREEIVRVRETLLERNVRVIRDGGSIDDGGLDFDRGAERHAEFADDDRVAAD